MLMASAPSLGGLWQGTSEIDSPIDIPKEGPGSSGAQLAERLLSNVEPSFVENLGQISDPEVRYYSRGAGLAIGLRPDGICYMVYKEDGRSPPSRFGGARADAASFRMSFMGCNQVEPVGRDPPGQGNSFLLGNDPSRWVRDARSYGEVLYEGLYDGIDLRFHFKEGELKYDYFVGPGADASRIRHSYEGDISMEVDPVSQDLLIRTEVGMLRDGRPVIGQDGMAGRIDAPGAFELLDGCTCAFTIPSEVSRDRAFIIDPGLVFSTYLGGSTWDCPITVTVARDDSIIVGGYTFSQDFPTTEDAFDQQSNVSSGFRDAFISKFSPEGALMRSTYIGGNLDEQVHSIVECQNGDIICIGLTDSSDFPTGGTPGPPHRGMCDGFIAKLSPTLGELIDGRFIGGSSYDSGCDVELLGDGSLVCTVTTCSSDLETTPGAYCRTYSGTGAVADAALLVKLGSSMELEYSTYVNRLYPADAYDVLWDSLFLSVDEDDHIYVAGGTNNRDFPVTPNGYSTAYNGGSMDGIVMKFDLGGGGTYDLLASTYIGGDAYDFVFDVEAGEDGFVYLTGDSMSSDFPLSPDALGKMMIEGIDYAFVTVLDGQLSKVQYSSYISGGEFVVGWNIEVGSDRTVHVLSMTGAKDVPTTAGCFDPLHRALYGVNVLYITSFNISVPELTYATYFGGDDYCALVYDSLDINSEDELVFTGYSTYSNIPTTEDAYDRIHGGGSDGIIACLDPHNCGLPLAPSNLSSRPGDGTAVLRWDPQTMKGYRVLEYRLYDVTQPSAPRFIETISADVNETEVYGLTNGVTYTLGVSAVNSRGEGPTVNATARPLRAPSSPIDLVSATGDGTVTLSWSPPLSDGGGILGYRISRGPRLGQMQPVHETRDSSELSYVDSFNLSLGGLYVYAVFAWNEAGMSPPSYVVQVAESTPGPPTAFNATPGDGQVALSWRAPDGNGGSQVLGYLLYRGSSEGEMTLMASLGWIELGYRDTGLLNGHTYSYCLTAINGHGSGGPTTTLNATPYGPPGPPTGPAAEPGDATVRLSWRQPDSDNGRRVECYRIFMGDSLETISDYGVSYETATNITRLRNGVTYLFQVAAVNAAGSGRWSNMVSATPYGQPSVVSNPSATQTPDGVLVRWYPPTDSGGSERLVYTIYRGNGPETTPVASVTNGSLEYLDRDIQVGLLYHYGIRAGNPLKEGPYSAIEPVMILFVPGAVSNVEALGQNGQVLVRWSPPEDNGGSSDLEYIVRRGLVGGTDGLEDIFWTDANEYLDTGLLNGRTYRYAIVARNERGLGPQSDFSNATPLGNPPAPILKLRKDDGRVVLTWALPSTEGTVPVTGFIVKRGTSMLDMKVISTLGAVYRYVDSGPQTDNTYFYQVIPVSSRGVGDPSELASTTFEAPPNLTAMLVVLVVVVIITMMSIRVLRDRMETMRLRRAEAQARRDKAGGAVVVDVSEGGAPRGIVEEVFAVHRDGRLIASCAREGEGSQDAELMSGMLIAVQGLVQDGLHQSGELESIKYGRSTILLMVGSYMSLAVTVLGEADESLRDSIETTLRAIETSYAGVIEDWTGDQSAIPGIRGMIAGIVALTKGIDRESITGGQPTQTVNAASAVDFHRGYVRLKVVVLNASKDIAADAAIAVEYDSTMLRLERLEPPDLRRSGDRVDLGNLGAGESRTVAFLFDPQICQGTHIDGLLTYFDNKGVRQRVEMRRRHAEVVCPIFFTREHANTAMLRRLIKEDLHITDMRLFRYPKEMQPMEALAIAKQALASTDIQLVREYIVEVPFFEAEVWYYGETKVTGKRMVMRVGVMEGRRLIEFFVAATMMETITGLLADFRRELERAIASATGRAIRLEAEFDEGVRTELGARRLLIDTQNQDDEPIDTGGNVPGQVDAAGTHRR